MKTPDFILILVGGLGTRLQSVLDSVPKPLAPILGKPFLHYQIKSLRQFFNDTPIYLLSHHLSEQIESQFANEPNCEVIKEPELLGTGGAIRHALQTLKVSATNTSFLVLNGDTYLTSNFSEFFTSAKEGLSILSSFQKDCTRYGTLEINNNQIVAFQEKKVGSQNSYINSGCYCFKNSELFSNLSLKIFALEEIIKEYIQNGNPVYPIKDDNTFFIDIGIPEDYETFQTYIKENKIG